MNQTLTGKTANMAITTATAIISSCSSLIVLGMV